MKNRKSYSRCPALLAVLTVCSTVLFLFSSCGSGNGKPSSVGSDDPADTYRGYLSEIRRLDHLTAKELAGHLKRWQTVKDSVLHACDGTRSACLVPMPVRCARGYTIRSASSSPVWPCRGHALTGSCSCSRSGSRPTPRTRSCAARPKRFARFRLSGRPSGLS